MRGNQFVKNYEFDYNFGPPWGHCPVVFTSVAGHIIKEDFPKAYGWNSCDPGALFDAPIERTVDEVRSSGIISHRWRLIPISQIKQLPTTLSSKHAIAVVSLYGPIVIEKVKILVLKLEILSLHRILDWK